MTAAAAKPEQQAAFEKAQRLQPISVREVHSLPIFTANAIWEGYSAPGYLAKRILEPRAITVFFGDQGVYKSTMALDLACCVASGRNFHGTKVRRAGVLYVAGEGCGGIRKRLRAWMMSHDLTAVDEQPSIAFTEAPASLIGDPEQLAATVQDAERRLGVLIELIVIDTLAANFGPGEENGSTDMTLAIGNARLAAPAAAVLLIHHSGHGDGGRERGSSSLPFGADFRFRAIYDKAARIIELRNLKSKDDETMAPMFFLPRRVGVDWTDSDGEELTAVVLDRAEESRQYAAQEPRTRTGASGLGANQEAVLKVLRRLYRAVRKRAVEEGRDPLEPQVLLDGLKHTVIDEKLVPAKRFAEAIEALLTRGLVRLEGPHIALSGEVE